MKNVTKKVRKRRCGLTVSATGRIKGRASSYKHSGKCMSTIRRLLAAMDND